MHGDHSRIVVSALEVQTLLPPPGESPEPIQELCCLYELEYSRLQEQGRGVFCHHPPLISPRRHGGPTLVL